jgi:N-sulphoglucosamine sulphohydrolase, C-terminal
LNGLQTSLDEIIANLDKLGGPESEPHYPIGWAWAGNTQFQWVKQVASHLGGTRNPMVISWPAKIKHDDKPRDCFLHLIHVVPTILEAAHVPMPTTVNGIKQQPLAGKSFLASFNDPNYKGRSEQYFEIFTNRSYYEDGWKADAQHTLPWRQDLAPGNWDKDKWELYNLDKDFSEANDLAATNPEKLAELKKKFDEAAVKFHVYPFDDRGSARLAISKPPVPGSDPKSNTFTYYPGAIRIAEPAAPPMKNRTWTLNAKVKIALEVNGTKVAEGKMKATVAGRFGIDTFGIGEDTGQPVTSDYQPPFKFTGEIEKVQIDAAPEKLSASALRELKLTEVKFAMGIE